MLPKNAQGPNTVQASGGSGKFLAGLGAMVAGGLAMNRRRVFEDELHERRKDLATHNASLDIVKKAMGYDLEQQHTRDMIPIMESGNLRKAGQLVRQAEITYTGGRPNTDGASPTPEKGAGSQTGKPSSVDDATPESSTSKMKPVKAQKTPAAKKVGATKAKNPGAGPSKPKAPTSKPAKPGVKKVGPAGKAPGKNGNVASANGNKKAGK